MKESTYKTYDELPLFLNAATVSSVLGVSPASAYELMHEKDFQRCASAAVWWCRKRNSSNGSSST